MFDEQNNNMNIEYPNINNEMKQLVKIFDKFENNMKYNSSRQNE